MQQHQVIATWSLVPLPAEQKRLKPPEFSKVHVNT